MPSLSLEVKNDKTKERIAEGHSKAIIYVCSN